MKIMITFQPKQGVQISTSTFNNQQCISLNWFNRRVQCNILYGDRQSNMSYELFDHFYRNYILSREFSFNWKASMHEDKFLCLYLYVS